MRKKLKIRVKKRSLESWENQNLYGDEDRITKDSMDNLPQLEKDEEYEQH